MTANIDTSELRNKLFMLLRERAFKRGRVILASGKESDYYFDMKPAMLDPDGAELASAQVYAGVALDPFQLERAGQAGKAQEQIRKLVAKRKTQLKHGEAWPFSLVMDAPAEGSSDATVVLEMRPADRLPAPVEDPPPPPDAADEASEAKKAAAKKAAAKKARGKKARKGKGTATKTRDLAAPEGDASDAQPQPPPPPPPG